jgi:hypothetical protein
MTEVGAGSEDRAERAFQVWAGEANRSDEKTAELTGIPRRTIAYYRKQYHWGERWLGLNEAEARMAVAIAQAEIRGNLPLVARRLHEIAGGRRPVRDAQGREIGQAYVSSDKDAVQAAKLIFQYGLDERSRGVEPPIEVPYHFPPDDENESLASLRARTSAMLEATVASVNTRAKRGRRI